MATYWNTIASSVILWIILITLGANGTSTYGEELNSLTESFPEIDDAALINHKRSWQNLQGSWGKRNYDIEDYGDTKYGNMHDKYFEDSFDGINNPLLNVNDEKDLQEDKRAWKSMNGAWGKRVNKDWNKFRGAWGKREPGWGNLKGLWGKRAGTKWDKLSPAWGKRDVGMTN